MAILLLTVMVVGVVWAVAFVAAEKNRQEHEYKMEALKSEYNKEALKTPTWKRTTTYNFLEEPKKDN